MHYIIWIFFLLFFNLHAADRLIIAGDNWCPYDCDDSNSQRGYVVELTQKIFEPHGIKVEYKTIPWARALRELEHGLIDGIIGASKIKERLDKGYLYPKETIGIAQSVFVAAKGDPWKYYDISSLETIILGVQHDYIYGEPLDGYTQKHIGNPSLIQLMAGNNTFLRNLEKIKLGRIDVAIEDKAVALYTMKQAGFSGEFTIAGGLEADPIYLTFSPHQNKNITTLFDQGIQKLRREKKLLKILEKYGLQDWKE